MTTVNGFDLADPRLIQAILESEEIPDRTCLPTIYGDGTMEAGESDR